MNIFYRAVGNKLPGERRPELPLRGSVEAWFWIVHVGSETEKFFKSDQGARANECLAKGGAILFLSSGRFGGLSSEAAARAFERGHNGRVYCLRAACTSTSFSVHDHVNRFLKTVSRLEPWAPIPWSEVEPPPTHENLLAVYLLIRAIEETSGERRSFLVDGWNAMPETWRATLLEAANREQRVLHGEGAAGLRVGLDFAEEDRRKTLEQITGF
jgi:hypothetical protein